jgi:hypothetical protein
MSNTHPRHRNTGPQTRKRANTLLTNTDAEKDAAMVVKSKRQRGNPSSSPTPPSTLSAASSTPPGSFGPGITANHLANAGTAEPPQQSADGAGEQPQAATPDSPQELPIPDIPDIPAIPAIDTASRNQFQMQFNSTAEENQMEQQLREMLGEQLTCAPICRWPDVVGFVNMLRFIRASQHDLSAAYTRVVSYIAMRKK